MGTEEPDDLTMLSSWRDGDQASGKLLFKKYFDPLYRFFSSKCAEPDEMVQSTFFAMVKAKDQFGGRSSFRTYIFTIARHELYRHLRTLKRDRTFDPELSSIADMGTSIGGRMARNEDHRRLQEALRQLPVEQQTLLELHYWEDMDAPALAEVFEVAPGAIRTRLTRARAALRDVMTKQASAPADALASVEALETWARAVAR